MKDTGNVKLPWARKTQRRIETRKEERIIKQQGAEREGNQDKKDSPTRGEEMEEVKKHRW